MKITVLELPDRPDLYLEPALNLLLVGWASLPADRPSMGYGTTWLARNEQLDLIVPSAIVPLDRNIMLNPCHPAMAEVSDYRRARLCLRPAPIFGSTLE